MWKKKAYESFVLIFSVNSAFLNYENINLIVDNNGTTLISQQGQPICAATSWTQSLRSRQGVKELPYGIVRWFQNVADILMQE